jgi:hypothetical protein
MAFSVKRSAKISRILGFTKPIGKIYQLVLAGTDRHNRSSPGLLRAERALCSIARDAFQSRTDRLWLERSYALTTTSSASSQLFSN